MFFFKNKYTLWHIKLKICMKKTNFTSHKQYLFDPLLSKVYYSAFTLSEKKELTSLQKKQLQKTFSPVYMLSVQLTSMNVFPPCDDWKTLFFTKMFRCSEVFITAMLLRSLTQVLLIKSVFYKYLRKNSAILIF